MGYFDPRFERVSTSLGANEDEETANKHHKPSTLVSRNITFWGTAHLFVLSLKCGPLFTTWLGANGPASIISAL